MPFFSVIIPTYNRVAFLKRTLESVFAQRYDQFEIIVVDDGSTDLTMDYLKSLGQRVRIVHQPNLGPGAARNLGVKHAEGAYLAFLDSDDLWFPWTLDIYRKVIQECCEPSFLAAKPLSFSYDRELASIATVEIKIEEERFEDYFAAGDEWRWWGVSSFVIRRDVFEGAGGFVKEWVCGEDADLALRLGVDPGFVQIKAPATFAYREHDASATKNLNRTIAGIRSMVRAEREGRYPGGKSRARERRLILTRHVRPVVLECFRVGLRREAWWLYVSTFGWNASLGRLKFLAGCPLMAMAGILRNYGRARVQRLS